MEKIMDHLNQMLEERVHNILLENSAENGADARKQVEADISRMEAIFSRLPDEDRKWLGDHLLEKSSMLEEKAQQLYMAGFRDALKLVKCLGL